MEGLQQDYPWIQYPLVVCAPMRNISLAGLALSVSEAGGLGFIGIGTDASTLEAQLSQAQEKLSSTGIGNTQGCLPVGVGFLNWGADVSQCIPAIRKYVPAAVWLFGAASKDLPALYGEWTTRVREATNGKTKIWIQICSVQDSLAMARLKPDVLVIQGADAGGHGLKRAAGIISLLPEVRSSLDQAGYGDIPLIAAGGVVDGRGLAAVLCLGAVGVNMGTRFLACSDSTIANGYQQELLRSSDGGLSTARTTAYDRARNILTWPADYDARGIINRTYVDDEADIPDDEIRRLYALDMDKGDDGWGPDGRLMTYAGTGIGLIKDVQTAAEIVKNIRKEACEVLGTRSKMFIAS